MRIGDKVRCSGYAMRREFGNQRSFSPRPYGGQDGIFLGWVDRYEGLVDWDGDGFKFFVQKKRVRLLRIQPLSNGRWRKPFDCFPEQVKEIL